MAASVEAGGATSMILGLVIARRGLGKVPKWLDYIARAAAVLGIAYSLYDLGGLTAITQLFELGIVVGFLVGTYLLAKQKPSGYPWFMLMNLSNAVLMALEGYPWLTMQQIFSFCFVLDAFLMQREKARKASQDL